MSRPALARNPYGLDQGRRSVLAAAAGAVTALILGAGIYLGFGHAAGDDQAIPPPPPPPPEMLEAELAPDAAPSPERRHHPVATHSARRILASAPMARSAPQFGQSASSMAGAAHTVPALMIGGTAFCDWAAHRSEQMICRDGELARYEGDLARAMSRAAQAGVPQWLLAAEHDRWASEDRERAAERSRSAVVELYRQRIALLDAMARRP